jgi:hypothetical protein
MDRNYLLDLFTGRTWEEFKIVFLSVPNVHTDMRNQRTTASCLFRGGKVPLDLVIRTS